MFSLTAEQNEKVNKWLVEVIYPPMVAEQKKDPKTASLIFADEDGVEYPYTGAIGGGCSYEFTPTSLGIITRVIWYDGQSIDVTDYDW